MLKNLKTKRALSVFPHGLCLFFHGQISSYLVKSRHISSNLVISRHISSYLVVIGDLNKKKRKERETFAHPSQEREGCHICSRKVIKAGTGLVVIPARWILLWFDFPPRVKTSQSFLFLLEKWENFGAVVLQSPTPRALAFSSWAS